MTIDTTTAPISIYGRTMNRYDEQGFEPAFTYFKGITRTNLRTQNAVQMLLDRLPPEFAGKIEEEQRAIQEARAKAEAATKARVEEIDAYWEENPPDILTELPENEPDAGELFDILAQYRISKITYDFSELYHYEEFEGIKSQGTTILGLDEFYLDDFGDLPDKDDIGLGDFLEEAVQSIANEYARECPGKLTGVDFGTVTFDVAAREISVTAEVEVKATKTFEKSWKV